MESVPSMHSHDESFIRHSYWSIYFHPLISLIIRPGFFKFAYPGKIELCFYLLSYSQEDLVKDFGRQVFEKVRILKVNRSICYFSFINVSYIFESLLCIK